MAKILIVEDNALNIKLFCDLLAAHGHQPEAVTDSRNALDAARSFEPDLVITDIQLPHVSGLDLIRLIRKDEKLADVPIMAVTAYSARGDEERIRAAGAQAYVSKPISVVRFAQTVDELLKGERRSDGADAAGSSANEGARRARDSASRTARKTLSGDLKAAARLLDLGFLELDVLAHVRVVLPEAHLLGLRARVLLGHIEEARVGAADELDLDGCRLGHRTIPNLKKEKRPRPLKSRRPWRTRPILSTDTGS